MKFSTYLHFLISALRLKYDPNFRAPLTVTIHLTFNCENNCLYCRYDRNGNDSLTEEVLSNVCREIWELGGRRINYTGGEPLLRPDLAPIIANTKKIGFFVSISTSGTNVRHQIDALKLCDRVMLSFDGPFHIRKALCGEKSALESEEAVKLFRQHKIPFWTTTVLNKLNIPYIDWLLDFAKENNSLANFVLLQTQASGGRQFHPRIDQVADLMPSDTEYRQVLNYLIQKKKKGAPIGSSIPYFQEMLRWQDFTKITSPHPSPNYKCLAGKAALEMRADGMLFPCIWIQDRFTGVSVLEKGFKSAFEKMPRIDDCRSCLSSCWLEANLIFNLKWQTAWNWAKNLLKG